MSFINLNHEQNIEQYNNADFLIIGAGAAGILLAVELSKKQRNVVLVESGEFSISPEKQNLNKIINTKKVVVNAEYGRVRAIGGTTLTWGGGSLPFSQFDFEKKPWVELSGWPIGYQELSAYYDRANQFMGIDQLDYKNDVLQKIKLQDPGFDPGVLDYHVCKWAAEPNFQLLYKQYLKKNVTIIYNALVQKLEKNENNVIQNVAISNFENKSFHLRAKTVIIAAGGIETVRILLYNNIGDHSGWLGKCFMEHPCMEIGEIATENDYRLQKYFSTHIWRKRKYSMRLSLSPEFQKHKELLNCSASIMFTLPEEIFNPYRELLSFKKDFKLSRLIKVSGSFRSVFKSMWAYLVNQFYYKVNAKNKIVLMIEQEPMRKSYITLSPDLDEFNIPKANISWDISFKTWETAIQISNKLKEELERLQFGKVELYPHLKMGNQDWLNYLSDVNHHMGGTRTSAFPEDGVVDKNLQVWNVSNLFVCSCSVFATSSHSNPTLTLLALANRLSEWLLRDPQKNN